MSTHCTHLPVARDQKATAYRQPLNQQTPAHKCIDMRIDIRIDMHADMCTGMHIGMRIDMRMNVRIDVLLDGCTCA